jgi:hypothetical protein
MNNLSIYEFRELLLTVMKIPTPARIMGGKREMRCDTNRPPKGNPSRKKSHF